MIPEIDWTVFDKYTENTCTCRCGAVFRSHSKFVATPAPAIYARRPCPACGRNDNLRSESLDPELLLAGYNLSVADRSAVAHRARQHRMLVGARVLLWVLALACVVGSVYLFLHPEAGSTMTLPERERIQKLERVVTDLDKRVKELESKERP